jgi:putative chitinase
MVILEQGSRAPEVRELQVLLKRKGFDAGQADGEFGPKTKTAVMAFQSAQGLEADGVVGPKTWAALAAAPSRPTEPGPTTGAVSLKELRSIMPHLSAARGKEVLPQLNKAMAEAGINTPKRQAAFLAQLAHESAEFRFFEEIASGAAYEGRKDLGNTEPGDGKRFKGRGPIQLTGRSNYRDAGQALGLDLEGNPKRAADVDVGFRTAGWFWNSRKLNTYADQGNFREVTRRINGGFNGLAAREAYYARAKQVLGA